MAFSILFSLHNLYRIEVLLVCAHFSRSLKVISEVISFHSACFRETDSDTMYIKILSLQ